MRSYLSVGALRLLNELIGRARYEYISPYDLAVAFTGIKGPPLYGISSGFPGGRAIQGAPSPAPSISIKRPVTVLGCGIGCNGAAAKRL